MTCLWPKGVCLHGRVKLRGLNHSLLERDTQALAASCHGYVGTDISALCQEAAMCALRRLVAAQEQSSCAAPDQQQQQAPATSECHADPLPESGEVTSLPQDSISPCLQVEGLTCNLASP